MAQQWYIVHTYSGFEAKVKTSLEETVKKLGLEDQISDILVPMENVVELVKGGERKTTSRKFYPGYILVQMEMTDETWHVVKSTPKVTGFVGGQTKPMPITEAEVARVKAQMEEGIKKPKPKFHFEEGDEVKVIDGPFSNFNGMVEDVNEDKGKLRVFISIFGRATPVELEFVQVVKI
ncbi:MAG: transcription termination/antitermination protein NusG [Thermodesulfobacteriota bacterium]|nr:transcription termination/antitermination protein NusG [Thermodesulfobacteriota bacterium]